MSQPNQMSGIGPMQSNQMGNQMMNPNTMTSMNSMNANTGMIGTNPSMGNSTQMQQQQMIAGNMMNTNNQMVGQMNNMNPMATNACNQIATTSATDERWQSDDKRWLNECEQSNDWWYANAGKQSNGWQRGVNNKYVSHERRPNAIKSNGSEYITCKSSFGGSVTNSTYKPGAQTPPTNVLQVVKEVQEEYECQHGNATAKYHDNTTAELSPLPSQMT